MMKAFSQWWPVGLYIFSPSSIPFPLDFGFWIRDLDLVPGFGTWIWDMDLGLNLGLTINHSKSIDKVT